MQLPRACGLIIHAHTIINSRRISWRWHVSVLCAQAGLVNLTKLRQLDLRWNADNCSGDLRLNGHSVSKVSEVYGDYSTVLANQGEGRRPWEMIGARDRHGKPRACIKRGSVAGLSTARGAFCSVPRLHRRRAPVAGQGQQPVGARLHLHRRVPRLHAAGPGPAGGAMRWPSTPQPFEACLPACLPAWDTDARRRTFVAFALAEADL